MAGNITTKLKEMLSKIQLIQETTIDTYAPETFPEHLLKRITHLKNLKCIQIEGDIIDLQLK